MPVNATLELTLNLHCITPGSHSLIKGRGDIRSNSSRSLALLRLEVDSRPIKIVSRDGLIKMKRIAGRLQDLADIEALERIK